MISTRRRGAGPRVRVPVGAPPGLLSVGAPPAGAVSGAPPLAATGAGATVRLATKRNCGCLRVTQTAGLVAELPAGRLSDLASPGAFRSKLSLPSTTAAPSFRPQPSPPPSKP